MKEFLRSLFEKSTGFHVMRRLPFGNDRFVDLDLVFPGRPVRTIVDVGAHVGQTTALFRKVWPEASIHSCEPVSTTFAIMRDRVGAHGRTHLHRVAIGAKRETLEIHLPADGSSSDMGSLNAAHPALREGPLRSESVEVITLMDLFERANIDRVDHLKIDTVGHEMAVIDGAVELFKAGRIGVIDVELGMNPGNTLLVPLAEMTARLAGLGHELFGLYDQVHEWPTKRPVLRRCNALFIPEDMARPGTWSPFEGTVP